MLKSKAAATMPLLKAVYEASERYRLIYDTHVKQLQDLDISIGNNCNGSSCVINGVTFNINNSDIFAPIGKDDLGNNNFGLAIIINENGAIAQETGGKAKKGSIVCYDRKNKTYEKVCLGLGSRDFFIRADGSKIHIL